MCMCAIKLTETLLEVYNWRDSCILTKSGKQKKQWTEKQRKGNVESMEIDHTYEYKPCLAAREGEAFFEHIDVLPSCTRQPLSSGRC